jgi:hypothetical protein
VLIDLRLCLTHDRMDNEWSVSATVLGTSLERTVPPGTTLHRTATTPGSELPAAAIMDVLARLLGDAVRAHAAAGKSAAPQQR